MDAIECIATRRSIRRYQDMPVDFETMMTVIQGGALAPSAGNLQDWKFILVTEKGIKAKLSEHSLGQPCVHNAAFLVVICSHPHQTIKHYGLRGERLYTVQNASAAAENMLLTAHALGLGGVWIGAFDEGKVGSVLGIPDEARPQAILAFGYPNEVPAKKRVTDLKLMVRFNSYGGKIRDVPQLVRDYSIKWEAKINQAHDAFDKIKQAGTGYAKKATKDVRKKGIPMFENLKKKLKLK